MSTHRRSAIETILHSLPVLPERIHTVEDEAKVLDQMIGLALADDDPRFDPIGTSGILKELQELHDRCFFLWSFVAQMKGPSLKAVRKAAGCDVLDKGFRDAIGRVSDAANTAYEQVSAGPKISAPRNGRRPDKSSASIVLDAASAYERLTGLAPSMGWNKARGAASGGFVRYVECLFVAVGIPASAQSQVKLYLKRKKMGDLPKTRTFRL